MEKYKEIIRLLGANKEIFRSARLELARQSKQSGSPCRLQSLQKAKNELSAALDLLLSTSNRRYKELHKLKNTRQGRVVLLLGSGPSASMIDWEQVKHDRRIDIAVVNYFKEPPRALQKRIKTVVISDPGTLNMSNKIRVDRAEDRKNLVEKLHEMKEARIFLPRFYMHDPKYSSTTESLRSRITIFSDYESRIFGGISPTGPRSYVSMTLLKALSIVSFLGYSKILLIGADNDYASTMRVLPDNSMACIDKHAGRVDTLIPQNNYQPLEYYQSLAKLESSWHTFSKLPVLNLDPLSFVSAFRKVTPTSEYFSLLQPEFQDSVAKLSSLLS